MSIKSRRIANDMQVAISQILREEVSDSHVKLVTITNIDLTNDISYAKVYFTTMMDGNKKETEKALNHAAKHIKAELGHRMKFRKTPALSFVYDESIEYGKHIENIISKLD